MKKLLTDRIFGKYPWYWHIINWTLHIKWKKREEHYKFHSQHLNAYYINVKKAFGTTDFDCFNPEDLHKLDLNNWGSVRPDILSAFVRDNSIILSNDNLVTGLQVITEYNEGILGKNWNGDFERRNFSSGLIESKNIYGRGIFTGTIKMFSLSDNFLGSWVALWIYGTTKDNEKEIPFDDRPYFEVDFYERMINNDKDLFRTTISVHYGTNKNRKLFSRTIKFKKPCNRAIPVACIIDNDYIRVFYFDTEVFRTTLAYNNSNRPVKYVFSDAVSANSEYSKENLMKYGSSRRSSLLQPAYKERYEKSNDSQ